MIGNKNGCAKKKGCSRKKACWMRDHDAQMSMLGLSSSAALCAFGGHIGYRGKKRGWLYLVMGVVLATMHGLRLKQLRRQYRLRAQKKTSPLDRLMIIRRW